MPAARSSRVALLVLGVGVATVLMSGVYLWSALPPTSGLLGSGWSPEEPVGSFEMPSLLPPVGLAGVKVAVLEDLLNERVTAPGRHRWEAELWRELVRASGGTIAASRDAEVLVLPHALCLPVELRRMLQRHLERGGGVVSTGALGSHGANCAPRADTLLAALLGGGPDALSPLATSEEGSSFAVILGETVLGAHLPPGTRLEVRPAEGQLVFRGSEREAYYAGFDRQPRPHRRERHFDAAVLRSRVGPGRLAAFGFALSELAPGWSSMAGAVVGRNALSWAAGRPVAEIAPWPGGAEGAVLIAADVEHEIGNALRAGEALDGRGYPATWFLLGSAIQEHGGGARRLASMGEAGSHTVDHRILPGQPYERQVQWLAHAQRELDRAIGRTATGLRPPEERFDAETVRAWRAVGGDYIVSSNSGRTTAPELIAPGGDTIVLLPRTAADDYQYVAVEELRDRRELLRRLLADFEAARALRGLYVMSFHSHILLAPELFPAFTAFLGHLSEAPGPWIADGASIARWWRARAALAVDVEDAAGEGYAIRVSNRGPVSVADAVLLVELPQGGQRRVPLPLLEPGKNVLVDLASPDRRSP